MASSGGGQSLQLLQSLMASLPPSGAALGPSKATVLELHQRCVQLATLQHELEQQLQQLDEAKMALTEQKVAMQNRLLSGLTARLQAAHATVDVHRGALLDQLGAAGQLLKQFQAVLQGTPASHTPAASLDNLMAQHARLVRAKVDVPMDIIEGLAETLAAGAEWPPTEAALPPQPPAASIPAAPASSAVLQAAAPNPESASASMVGASTSSLQAALDDSRQEARQLRAQLAAREMAAAMFEQRLQQALQQQAEALASRYKTTLDLLRDPSSRPLAATAAPSAAAPGATAFTQQDPMDMLRSALSLSMPADPAPRPPLPPSNTPAAPAEPASTQSNNGGAVADSSGSATVGDGRVREAYRRMLLDMQAKYRAEAERRAAELRAEQQRLEQAHAAELSKLHKQQEGMLALVLAKLTELAPKAASSVRQALKRQRQARQQAGGASPGAADAAVADGFSSPARPTLSSTLLRELLVRDDDGNDEAAGSSPDQLRGDDDGGLLTKASVVELVAEAVRGKEAQDRAELIRLQEAYRQQMASMQDQYQSALRAREGQYAALLAELKGLRRSTSSSDTLSTSGSSKKSTGRPGANHSMTSLSHDKYGASVLSLSSSETPVSGSSSRSISLTPGPQLFVPPPTSAPSDRQVGKFAQAVLATSTKTEDAAAASQGAMSQAGAAAAACAITRQQQAQAQQQRSSSPPQQPGMGAPPSSLARPATASSPARRAMAAARSSPRKQPSPHRQAAPTPTQPSAAAVHAPEATLVCARCGMNDVSSPGVCRFHPALVTSPGPLLYGPEWHACRAAGHKHGTLGCYVRKAHHYPEQAAAAKTPAAVAGGGTAGTISSPFPRPRSQLPQPSAY